MKQKIVEVLEKFEILRAGTHGCNGYTLGFIKLFGHTPAEKFASLKLAFNEYCYIMDVAEHERHCQDFGSGIKEEDAIKAIEKFILIMEDREPEVFIQNLIRNLDKQKNANPKDFFYEEYPGASESDYATIIGAIQEYARGENIKTSAIRDIEDRTNWFD